MSKKILSQTLKHPKLISAKDLNKSQLSNWEKTKDFVVTLGAISGILAGLLWLGGRFYAFGYFEKMSIPLYFLSFTSGEYAEVYTTSIIANLINLIIINFWNICALIILSIITSVLLRTIQKRYKGLKIREAIWKIEGVNRKFLLISWIALFLLSFIAAYNNGKSAAHHILTNSQSITIYSNGFVLPETLRTSTNDPQNPSLYTTTGLYLLTHNNEKYYLFRELDPVSCKPKQVFIIPDSELISVFIEEASAFPSCNLPPLP